MTNETKCECPLGLEYEAAGPVARLCHHSSLEAINTAMNNIKDLVDKFDANIDLRKLYTMPPNEGINYYISVITNGDTRNISLLERAIYTSAFMRDYMILIQMSMLQTLGDIRRNVVPAG